MFFFLLFCFFPSCVLSEGFYFQLNSFFDFTLQHVEDLWKEHGISTEVTLMLDLDELNTTLRGLSSYAVALNDSVISNSQLILDNSLLLRDARAGVDQLNGTNKELYGYSDDIDFFVDSLDQNIGFDHVSSSLTYMQPNRTYTAGRATLLQLLNDTERVAGKLQFTSERQKEAVDMLLIETQDLANDVDNAGNYADLFYNEISFLNHTANTLLDSIIDHVSDSFLDFTYRLIRISSDLATVESYAPDLSEELMRVEQVINENSLAIDVTEERLDDIEPMVRLNSERLETQTDALSELRTDIDFVSMRIGLLRQDVQALERHVLENRASSLDNAHLILINSGKIEANRMELYLFEMALASALLKSINRDALDDLSIIDKIIATLRHGPHEYPFDPTALYIVVFAMGLNIGVIVGVIVSYAIVKSKCCVKTVGLVSTVALATGGVPPTLGSQVQNGFDNAACEYLQYCLITTFTAGLGMLVAYLVYMFA